MSTPGRGRGESKNVQIVDEMACRAEQDSPTHSGSPTAVATGSQDPIRGRGGFRQTELRTIPANVTSIKAENVSGCRSVDIMANYVTIVPKGERTIQKYRVDFKPMVESAMKLNFLFRSAAQQLFTNQPIYDGVHECRTAQKLNEDVKYVIVKDSRDGADYKVTFTNTGSCTHGMEFLRTYNMHMKSFLRAMGYYSPQMGLYVHPDQYDQVGKDILLLRGFRTAAAVHDGNKILMNLEAAHKISQRSNVLDLMTSLKDNNRGQDLPKLLNANLTGKIVVTAYNKRCYRIEEVDVKTRPTSTFDRNGQPMTFLEFYESVHNLTIRDHNQPMLKVVPNNRRRVEGDNPDSKVLMLVPELCNIAGLTETQRNDNRLKMDLIKASQVPPSERVRQLRIFLQEFHSNDKVIEQLQNWGYSYNKEPVKMRNHVLPMTGYACGAVIREPPNAYPKADLNTADIRINTCAHVPKIKKMVIIIARNQLRDKGRLSDMLKSGFQSINLRPDSVGFSEITDGDSPNHYVSRIRSLDLDTTVAIVIMQAQNKERYDAIKKAASVEKGLITQVVTAKLLLDERKSRSACQKIAIQVAAKVGGEPWWVDIPLKKAMICGYDTYHDTARKGRSIGAFIVSLNIHYSRWWSKADAHDRLDEISTQMSVNIVEALKVYRTHNNDELPENIIIYRDGVGEGQLEHVFRVELETVNKVIKEVGPIKLTMVVVNKRIGARFYMRSGAGENFSNPPPGTVIDHTITREQRYDFYLISQSTRQGTVTPTYYNIIHDESGFPPQIHQKLAFKLCLLYYNWSGTVRVPAPCQYAHKLALLCGEHLHSQPNAQLDDKLHFL